MKIQFIILFYFLFQLCTFAQETIRVDLYENTKDFIDKNHNKQDVVAEKTNSHYPFLSHFKFNNWRKNKKDLKNADHWAVSYGDDHYVNLASSIDLHSHDNYVRLDYINDLCAFTIVDQKINKAVPQVVHGVGIGTHRNGRQGFGIFVGVSTEIKAVITNPSKTWVNEEGEKKAIIFIDLARVDEKIFKEDQVLPANFLTAKYLKKHLGMKKPVHKIKEMKFEEVIDFIKNRTI